MPDSSLIPGLSWRTAAVTANANKTEYVYFGSTVGYTITGIKFIPSDTVAADNTDYRVITITANSQAIVAVDSRAASLNGWTAGTVKELTLASDTAATGGPHNSKGWLRYTSPGFTKEQAHEPASINYK